MLVRVIIDWKSQNTLLRQTPDENGHWDGIDFTFEKVDECDLLIVCNRPREEIKIKCSKTGKWLISMEPPTKYHEFHLHSFSYFDKIITQHTGISNNNIINSHGSLPWKINKSYDDLSNCNLKFSDKMDKCSFVLSKQNWLKGHKVRLEFYEYLNNVSDKSLDIYGWGINPITDKFEALYPYKYSIAIENSCYNNYWTEKISDCFLTWTMPIYFGCPNINEYFPDESFLLIDPKDPKSSLEIINEAICGDVWSKSFEAINYSRNLVLNKYQFFPRMKNEIDKTNNLDKKKKNIIIPCNPAPWENEKWSYPKRLINRLNQFLKFSTE
tara:strand:+ start:154 stop:1131 length:978 start_codon:yes stop_codon:yes gene_type:complete